MKRSIGLKLFIAISLFALVIVGITWFMNSYFLENYYLTRKQENLISQSRTVKNIYDGNIENILVELEKVEDSIGGNITILSQNGNIKFTSSMISYGNQMRKGNMMGNVYSYYQIAKENIDKILKGETVLGIYEHPRFFTKILISVTLLKNNDLLILETPISTIKEGVKIAQEFYIYIGGLSLIIGTIVAFIFSKFITKPIIELNNVAKKMASLDFNSKYNVKSQDEIGELGKTINYLSYKLGDTIKELNEANKRLKEDIDRERELEETRKEFVSSVSHELKTPVSLIQGYAEGLKDNIAEDEETKNFYCNVIIEETNKMGKLIGDLLDLSHLESGQLKLKRESFDVKQLIEKTIEKYRNVFVEKEIKVLLNSEENLPKIYGDITRIEQVIVNFINNAINYVNVNGEIIISVTKRDDRVRVGVYNTGSHIPEEEKSKIWDRFYKIDKARTRKIGGTGLGLSIVKKILELHGSSFGVENKPEGVEFWFDLKMKE